MWVAANGLAQEGAEDPPADNQAAAEKSPGVVFQEKLNEWKTVLMELRRIQAVYTSVDEVEAAEIRRLFPELIAQGEALITELSEVGMLAYAAAPVEQREEVLDSALSGVTATAERLEAHLMPGARLPFFEDAAGAAGLSLPQAEIAALARHLIEYVHLTARLAAPRSEQAAMRHFFDDFYGPDPRSVPLLQFYEEYYRKHFKAHLARQE